MKATERDPASDPPRRIALVITRGDVLGGAQAHVYELARGLRVAGHEVAVFVGGDGVFVDQLRAAAIPVWLVRSLKREIDLRADLRALRELRMALRAFSPHLVSTHTTKAGWVGRVVARSMKIPVVVTAHGWLLTPGRLGPRQKVARFAERSLTSLAETVIAVSHYDHDLAREHDVVPEAKLRVVHNALPDVAESLLAAPAETPPRIISVARFETPKDPLALISALSRLPPTHPWTCELIGDGSMRPRVEDAIARADLGDRVTLLGERDDVPERLAAAQVFVLPTRREGFPISILEAMRAGLPVVANDVGGIAEAVVHGETGSLVPAGDPDALAAALGALISQPAVRVAQGAAGRRRFEAEFSFAPHVRRIWAAYAEAMGCSV